MHPPEDQKIKVLVVGFGYWGPNIVRNLLAHPHFQVCGIVDPDPQSNLNSKRLFRQVNTFSSLDEALREPGIEVMAIVSPPKTHCAIALRGLEAGMHLLIEKPLATSVEECDRIIATALKKKLKVMVDHTFCYNPAVQYIHQYVQAGHMGKILYYDSSRINFDGYQPDIDVIEDLAPHDLSILDLLLGGRLPDRICAIGMKCFNQKSVDLAHINAFYGDRFMAHLHMSWISPIKLRTVLLGGELKMVVYDENLATEKVRVYDKTIRFNGPVTRKGGYRVGDMTAPYFPEPEALSTMIDAFYRYIRHGEIPHADMYAGKRIVQIIEAARRSLADNGKITQPDPGDSSLCAPPAKKAA
jgi:predicted dehydrogenase